MTRVSALLSVLSLLALVFAHPARAETFRLTPENTSITFVSRWGLMRPEGRVTHLDGRLAFERSQATQSSVDVTIDMRTLEMGHPSFSETLKGPGGFDVEHFPTARFRSVRVDITGPGHADMTGDLTLHGITRRIVMKVTFADGVSGRFSGTARIRRGDFGVDIFRFIAGDEIDLKIESALTLTIP